MKKNFILSIDTSQIDTAKVAFEKDGKRFEKISDSKRLKSQMVLPLIESLLNEHNLIFSDISEIWVHTGPGSFTGLRIGIAVANTLGLLLGIPVNGKKTIAAPTYS